MPNLSPVMPLRAWEKKKIFVLTCWRYPLGTDFYTLGAKLWSTWVSYPRNQKIQDDGVVEKELWMWQDIGS